MGMAFCKQDLSAFCAHSQSGLINGRRKAGTEPEGFIVTAGIDVPTRNICGADPGARLAEVRFFATIGEAMNSYLEMYAVDWTDWEDRA